jgi:hypothetical protein
MAENLRRRFPAMADPTDRLEARVAHLEGEVATLDRILRAMRRRVNAAGVLLAEERREDR